MQVVVASMDGVNVLVREPGNKNDRPEERPDKKRLSENTTLWFNTDRILDGSQPDNFAFAVKNLKARGGNAHGPLNFYNLCSARKFLPHLDKNQRIHDPHAAFIDRFKAPTFDHDGQLI